MHRDAEDGCGSTALLVEDEAMTIGTTKSCIHCADIHVAVISTLFGQYTADVPS